MNHGLMDELKHLVKDLIDAQITQIGVARHARVENVDPARAVVRVSYDEEGTLSGWLPVTHHGAGNGWSFVTLPTPGTQVFVIPDMGDMAHGVVVGATHSVLNPPGRITPYKATESGPLVPGEPTLMGPGGQSIRLASDGSIQSRGTWLHDGDFKASGQVSDLDSQHGTVNDLRVAYDAHEHTSGAPGSKTSTTDHPLP